MRASSNPRGSDQGEHYCPAPDVMVREVGGEAVLLDLEQGRYYGLDEVGCRIWRLVEESAAPDEIVRHLIAEYEVEEERVRRDVSALLSELVAAGLVHRSPAASAKSGAPHTGGEGVTAASDRGGGEERSE